MASKSLPPSEKEMNTYGGMFAASTFVTSVLGASLLVVQIVVVLYGVSGFLATPKDRRKGRLRFIIISLLMLAMCAIDIGFDLWKGFLILYTGGPDGVSYLRALNILYENWLWDAIGDTFLLAGIGLGDALMASKLWRCLVLWTDRKWVVLFPSLACIGSIASTITYLVGITSSNSGLRNKTELAGAVLNITMNIMITFLIVLRMMRARSRAAKAFPDQQPPRWYSEVTALVIESAAPLAIFGACFIALQGTIVSQGPASRLQSGCLLQRGRHNIITGVFRSFYNVFCTLSPQMVIFRVTRGKAWNSSMVEATGEGTNLSQPIQFTCSTRETTTSKFSASV
ncbi:hypothetical protein BKA70DRAFT_1489596 [Coprinopsis sp. MPI-PUGE-AT-0042]|nr:hypothetical protein BKA70DRAFT_1489596 [Coprinopsis sp. MPI-PUGE-AT-0042]